MSEPITRPVRAHVIVMKVEGDTIADIANHLNHIAFQLHAGQMQTVSISGGPATSHIFEHRVTEKSHDDYFAELDAYLEQLRAAEVTA